MSEEQAAVCFTCGQPSGDILRLNTLPNGKVCPACRDRLLEGIPAPFPSGEGTKEGAPARNMSPSEVSPELNELIEDEPVPVHLNAQKGPGRLIHGDGPNEPA